MNQPNQTSFGLKESKELVLLMINQSLKMNQDFKLTREDTLENFDVFHLLILF